MKLAAPALRPRSLARALVIATLATGCVGGSKAPGYVVGSAISIVGVGLVASTGATDCSSREFGDAIDCGARDLGRGMIGTVALAAGLGVLLATALIPTPGATPADAAER